MTKFAALLVSHASMGDTCDQKSKTQLLPLPTSMVMQRASITRLNSWFHGTLDILMVPSISKLNRAQETCALSTRAIDSPENGKMISYSERERYIYKYITSYISCYYSSQFLLLWTLWGPLISHSRWTKLPCLLHTLEIAVNLPHDLFFFLTDFSSRPSGDTFLWAMPWTCFDFRC